MTPLPVAEALEHEARRTADIGFAFVPATHLRAALGAAALAAWPAFAESWNRLELDTYMADGGRYRRRRYATLSAPAEGDTLAIEPEQPHYQSRDYNRLNGGIARHFAPIDAAVLAAPTLQSVLRLGLALFRRALSAARGAHRGASVPHRGARRCAGPPDARGRAP